MSEIVERLQSPEEIFSQWWEGEIEAGHLIEFIKQQAARIAALERRLDECEIEATLDMLEKHINDLQCALAFWMPSVWIDLEEEMKGRVGDDACLLYGYEGEVPAESWGDKAYKRIAELEAQLRDAGETLKKIHVQALFLRGDQAYREFPKAVARATDTAIRKLKETGHG